MRKFYLFSLFFLTALVSLSLSKNLQEQLDDVSQDGGTVTLADGTYSGSGYVGVSCSSTKSVTLQGSSAARTIIDCKGDGPFLYVTNGNPFNLKNMVIKNCKGQMGGAVKAEAIFLNLQGVTFEDNEASQLGGALYVGSGEVNIQTSTFTNNKAQKGGALGLQAIRATNIQSSTFSQNEASASGGSIYYESGEITLTSVTFEDSEVNANEDYENDVTCISGRFTAVATTTDATEPLWCQACTPSGDFTCLTPPDTSTSGVGQLSISIFLSLFLLLILHF